MRELLSYAVGCMFGRYSLDKPGLILANQGETLRGLPGQFRSPASPPMTTTSSRMLDGDWFADDIAERFRSSCAWPLATRTTRTTSPSSSRRWARKASATTASAITSSSEFYTDHVKRYKKRPIYWLFSSPKGSFNALIYMHRYRPDTVSVVLNDYLREFRTKLTDKNHQDAVSISTSASSQGEKTKA
jgi:hypothetical protein